MTELSDVKAGLNQTIRVLEVLQDMAFDLRPVGGPPALCGQIECMQALFDMLMPFVQKLDADLDRFPDRIEAMDGRAS